jgi:hypothetical protein
MPDLTIPCSSIASSFILIIHLLRLVIVRRADSGHGGQTKDLDGDEADGYDEGFPFYLALLVAEILKWT